MHAGICAKNFLADTNVNNKPGALYDLHIYSIVLFHVSLKSYVSYVVIDSLYQGLELNFVFGALTSGASSEGGVGGVTPPFADIRQICRQNRTVVGKLKKGEEEGRRKRGKGKEKRKKKKKVGKNVKER